MNENAKSELNVFVRVLRTLANSRELTLLVLIIILVFRPSGILGEVLSEEKV